MKRCLICAGLVAAIWGGDFGDAVPRVQAQVAATPANPNGLTPQQVKQMQRMRRMMRLRRHHRRVRTTMPTTSMIQNQNVQHQLPGAVAAQNPAIGNNAAGKMTAQRKKQIAAQLRRASF